MRRAMRERGLDEVDVRFGRAKRRMGRHGATTFGKAGEGDAAPAALDRVKTSGRRAGACPRTSASTRAPASVEQGARAACEPADHRPSAHRGDALTRQEAARLVSSAAGRSDTTWLRRPAACRWQARLDATLCSRGERFQSRRRACRRRAPAGPTLRDAAETDRQASCRQLHAVGALQRPARSARSIERSPRAAAHIESAGTRRPRCRRNP